MEESYQTAALTASGLSWAAVQQLSGISGGLETRRPKIDLRSRAVDKPKQGVEFSIFHRVGSRGCAGPWSAALADGGGGCWCGSAARGRTFCHWGVRGKATRYFFLSLASSRFFRAASLL